jgi:hypothetical protein
MNPATISALVIAIISLIGALTAWLKSHIATKVSTSTAVAVNQHLAAHNATSTGKTP